VRDAAKRMTGCEVQDDASHNLPPRPA
jgi:hypothetical protein